VIPERLEPDTIWLHPPAAAGPRGAARLALRGWLRPQICAADAAGSAAVVSDDIASAVAASRAAIRAHGEEAGPVPAEWRVAIDPVCLQAGMRDMQISHPEPPGLECGDARRLAAAITVLLDDDSDARLRRLRLEVAAPNRWYLSGATADRLRMVADAPAVAAATALQAALPTGEDAALVRRLMTEIQMVLHAHPVNAARADAGLPPVNSVWMHGAGSQPVIRRRALPALVTDDPVLRGVWRLAGAGGACTGWEDRAVAAALEQPGAAGVVLGPADAATVRELAPALQLAVGSGRVRRLYVPLGDGMAIASPRDRWCLWRQATPGLLKDEGEHAPTA
jgi:hypothetical protein